ncbi:flavin-containing monooxygenase [Rhodococcus erythropolis]|uniref:flavin-containing monooxygenase n=1 Tax=Rhodococcus erythropolis TaxID=1833 RepID=UPI002227F09D|nr:NAD(P)/FAD-dependent oxidoreductase [Rhodococcus erythropolis]MCW2295427.1 4-hydroxyacetophenone monooxygenase [Rhodococcus erythropolis]
MSTVEINPVGQPVIDLDDASLETALSEANLPTLLLVLRQITGDDAWLGDPYRPTRSVALNDNDGGGFTPEIQDHIRRSAFEVLREVRDGVRTVPEPPADSAVPEWLSVSLGEKVPQEYASTMAEEAGLHPRTNVAWTNGRPAAADTFSVLVIGAGPSGIATGATLARLGIPFTVVERGQRVGGVWAANDYPGAGVDTPTHLYSFSFAPRRGWTRFYAKQAEILQYFEDTAREHAVLENIQFETEVTESIWSENEGLWYVTLAAGGTTRTVTARAVVSCVGMLANKSIPHFTGMDEFTGPMFHSSEWDHTVDITGKKVAVIGTGATSMQIVPAIVDKAAEVQVFQRSPQWIVPNANYLRDVPANVRLLMEHVPFYAGFYRLRLIWQFQDKLLSTLYKDPNWEHPERSVNAKNDKHRVFLTDYVTSQLASRPELVSKVLPTYPPYGKRILMDNQWMTTIQRGDVTLIDDGVTGFDEGHVLTADGSAYDTDVVVLATGFKATKFLWPINVVGRDGVVLREVWGDDDATAYLGIAVPKFPNLFIVGGPNTALAHGGSFLYTAECAMAYTVQMIIGMIERGTHAVEVRQDVTDAYIQRVDAEHDRLIWTHEGMNNWYRNKAGRVVAPTPWRGVDYWAMTREPDISDYVITDS